MQPVTKAMRKSSRKINAQGLHFELSHRVPTKEVGMGAFKFDVNRMRRRLTNHK